MRFASIAVLLLLTAGCGREKAGTPAAEPSRGRDAARRGASLPPRAAPAPPDAAQSEPAAAPRQRSLRASRRHRRRRSPLPNLKRRRRPDPDRPRRRRRARRPGAAETPVSAPPTVDDTRPSRRSLPPRPQHRRPRNQQPPRLPRRPHRRRDSAAATPDRPSPPRSRRLRPELDLNALKDQLRETKAIGFMTKLTLKNQVDDLLDRFRDYYHGKTKVTMKELRRSYDLLMMKVLSLLQDADQQLASAIVASREAIWGLLADPVKFETLQG